MDEDERQRKLLAGKAMLAQYVKKKKSAIKMENSTKETKNKLPNPESAGLENVVFASSKSIEAVCENKIDLEAVDVTQEVPSGNQPPEQQLNSDVRIAPTALGSSSFETGSALNEIEAESDILMVSSDLVTLDHSLSSRDFDMNLKIEECHKKLQEYHSALNQRNGVISQLTETLRSTFEQRDKLQLEASSQADALAREITTLKLQLQQANEFLQNQKGKNGISAEELLEAKNYSIALQQDSFQKDLVIEELKQNMMNLRSELASTKYKCGTDMEMCNNELQKSLLQLKEKENLVAKCNSENDSLKMQLGQESKEKSSILLELKQKDEANKQMQEQLKLQSTENERLLTIMDQLQEERIDSKKKLQNAYNENVLLQDVLAKKEEESAAIQYKLQQDILDLTNKLQASKDLLEENKLKSSNEVKLLMEQLEDIHKRAAYSDMEGKAVGKQLEVLQAELDEQYGNQIVQMKEAVVQQFQSEIDRLKNELLNAVKEKDQLASYLASCSTVISEETPKSAEFSSQLAFSLSSPEVEVLQEKLREIICEKENLEVSYKEQWDKMNQTIQTLTEANCHLKNNFTDASEKLEAQKTVIEQLTSEAQEAHIGRSLITTLEERIFGLQNELEALQELKAKVHTLTLEKVQHDQVQASLRNEIENEKQISVTLNTQLDKLKSELDNAKSDNFVLLEENSTLKHSLNCEIDRVSHLNAEVELLHRRVTDFETHCERLNDEKQKIYENYQNLKGEFDVQFQELQSTSLQFSEVKIHMDSLEEEKILMNDESERLKEELKHKSELFDNMQEKLQQVYKQFEEMQQHQDELHSVHNRDVNESTNWDISINFDDIVKQFSELRVENERLHSFLASRNLNASDSLLNGSSMCVLFEDRATSPEKIDNDADICSISSQTDTTHLSDNEVDWKRKYDNLLQEMLQLQSQYHTIHGDKSAVSEKDALNDPHNAFPVVTSVISENASIEKLNAGLPVSHTINVPRVTTVIQSSSTSEMQGSGAGVIVSASVNSENQILNVSNNQLQKETVNQHVKLDDLATQMQQESEIKTTLDKKNQELLVHITALQVEINDLRPRLQTAETTVTSLELTVGDLENACGIYEQRLKNLEKENELLKLQFEMERTSHQQVAEELQLVEAKLELLNSQNADIDSIKMKLESAVAEKEMQAIKTQKPYVLGDTCSVSQFDQHTPFTESKGFTGEFTKRESDESRCLTMETEGIQANEGFDTVSGLLLEIALLRTKLQEEEKTKAILESSVSELQKTCATYKNSLQKLEEENCALNLKLVAEQNVAQNNATKLHKVMDELMCIKPLLSAGNIDMLKNKLESTVAEQEMLAIKVEKPYLLGEGDSSVVPHSRLASAETDALLFQLKQELKLKSATDVRNQELIGKIDALEVEIGSLRMKIQNDKTVKATLESTISSYQKMCAVYEQKHIELENANNALCAQLQSEQLAHMETITELCALQEQLKLFQSSHIPSDCDIATLKSKLESAVAKQESQAITVQKAYTVEDNQNSVPDIEPQITLSDGQCHHEENRLSETSSVNLHHDKTVNESEELFSASLEEAKSSDNSLFPISDSKLSKKVKFAESLIILDGIVTEEGNGENSLEGSTSATMHSVVNEDKLKLEEVYPSFTNWHPKKLQRIASSLIACHDRYWRGEMSQSDAIKCECHPDSAEEAPTGSPKDSEDGDEKVSVPIESAIEMVAETVSAAALRRAQDLDMDLSDAKAELERQHEERLRTVEDRHLAELRNMEEELCANFESERDGLLSRCQDETRKLLQELTDLKDILRETEAKLQVAELKSSDEMRLRIQLEGEQSKFEGERNLLDEKIRSLEGQLHQTAQKEASLRQELQAQYDEDVEHVRQCLELSLSEEAQANLEAQASVEAEVDQLKERVEADIRARNEENRRLCTALQELKVQVEQLQADKRRLERLVSAESIEPDDILLELDDKECSSLTNIGAAYRHDWEQLSNSSEDAKPTSTQLQQLLIHLVNVYVSIAKTVNKELVTLFGTDLGVCEVTVSGFQPENNLQDKSQEVASLLQFEIGGVNLVDVGEGSLDASSLSVNEIQDALFRNTDNVLEEFVAEAGSKLIVAVQRLLGMLGASIQQLQESRSAHAELADSSLQSNDEITHLLAQNDELLAQLKSETQTKECLAVELHKFSGLLKGCEVEKEQLEDTLARKERQLEQVVCKFEDVQMQNQRLQDSLAEDQRQLKLHQEVIAEGLGEHAQMVKLVRTEPHSQLLATGGTELLEENTRLHHEKRGLQYRGEKDRSHLMGRIQELEQILEEQSASHELELEEKRKAITDLQQQIDALDKQLKGYKQFIEEQTAEREQEREDFQREMDKLHDVIREKDRAQNNENRLLREVELFHDQVKEKDQLVLQAVEKQEQVERELEALTEKMHTQQDVIRELERQLDCKSRNEKDLGEQMEELKLALSQTSKTNEDQSYEIEELRKMSSTHTSRNIPFLEELIDIPGLDIDNPPTAESVLLDLRIQVHALEDKVYRHARDLEGVNLTSSSLSSPCSEEVSVREQLDALRIMGRTDDAKGESVKVEPSFSGFLRDIQRLEDKIENLSRGKDVALKKLKDLEAQVLKQKHTEEELQQDREVLQQKLNTQLLQMSSLQARIEELRLGVQDTETIEQMHLLQEQLLKERDTLQKRSKQVEDLQERNLQMQEQCESYKKQLSSLLQQYNDDVTHNKSVQAAANLEISELKQQHVQLKVEAERSQRQSDEISSLLQTLIKEKNAEMDLLSAQLQQVEQEKDELKGLVAKQEEQLLRYQQRIIDEQQKSIKVEESLEEKVLELNEKVESLSNAEKELRRAWNSVEQKKREVDALKVVLEEKAQLVEQVKTLQAELINLSQYQARLQEDFDTVQAMLEERQQELAELNTVRDASLEEQVNLRSQIEFLQKQLSDKQHIVSEIGVQVDDCGKEQKDKLNDLITELQLKNDAQGAEITSIRKEFESAVVQQANYKKELERERQASEAAKKNVKDVLDELQNEEIKFKTNSSELEKVLKSLQVTEEELMLVKKEISQVLQQKTRLEAEIAWRDTKLFRLEDELEQLKRDSSKSVQNTDTKSSLQKFLQDVQNEVLQEYENQGNDNVLSIEQPNTCKSSVGISKSSKGPVWPGDDGHLTTSTDASVSESDADSLVGDSVPKHVKTLLRKVYKEGIHVLNLSELQAIQEHVNIDPSRAVIQKDSFCKAWENERKLLVAELQALKELLSQVTTIAATSRVQGTQSISNTSQILQFVSSFLSKERDTLLDQIRTCVLSRENSDQFDIGFVERSLSELNSLYQKLLQTLQTMIVTAENTEPVQLVVDSKVAVWEVQMAVAKERLKHQDDQKKLMQQLQSLDQQLSQSERQAKRQVELLEFRAQQELIIAEDLRHSLDLEKSRSIDLCSQLALEKGRASHLELTNVQLKSELGKCQMALEQEKQEVRNLGQQFKNEKGRADSLVQALQGERDSFSQLQEAMEAEKRRGKASRQREQQIIEELQQALETEREKQLELTAALEREKMALQNTHRDLLRAQNKPLISHMRSPSTASSCLTDNEQILEVSHNSDLMDDVREALELEKRKNQDLGLILQREHNRITLLTTALQQERRQLLEEIESEKNDKTQMETKLESVMTQKSCLQKELKREKEQVHRLELEHDKLSAEISVIRSEVHQREQETEALRRIQRDLHKEWEVEREQHRHQLRETQLELQRLQQKLTLQEKEMEYLKQSAASLQQNLSEEGKCNISINRRHSITNGASNRYQYVSLETIRERLCLLLLKVQDEMDGLFSKYNKASGSSRSLLSISFANTISALLTEVANMSQETWVTPQVSEGLAHLDITERIVRHNAELVKFAMQLSEEKLRLRTKLLQPREDAKSPVSGAQVNTQVSIEHVLASERAAWAQERSSLHKALHRAQADLMRASNSRFMLASPGCRLDDGKVSYYYYKYLRSQSFRRNLVYQKNYLLIVLGGFQDTEAATLEMLGRLGCLSSAYGAHHNLHHSKAFRKFRSAVRVVTSIIRMKFLVRKWKHHVFSIGGTLHHDAQERDDGFDVLSHESASLVHTPAHFSQYHSFFPGSTPPVRDIKSVTDSEHSVSPVVRRSLSMNAGSSSTSSSNQSITPLSDFVHRFDTIQEKLGIRTSDVFVAPES